MLANFDVLHRCKRARERSSGRTSTGQDTEGGGEIERLRGWQNRAERDGSMEGEEGRA